MDNACIYCGTKLKGRTDKKFCDDQCRNAWHNSNPNRSEAFIKKINKILRKNRSIMRFSSPEGKTTVRKDFILGLGFDFNYFTNHYTTKNNNTYHFCYDYGYLLLEDEKVLIVRWQKYMEKFRL
jgi:predicted nucleic acid-binding Zn ribbon protein